MKKKLSLKDLKVQSFVTDPAADKYKGGGGPDPLEPTFSCYDYISCGYVECLVRTEDRKCVAHTVVVRTAAVELC